MSDDVVGFSFLAESSIPVWYLKPGETIFKEGETAKELYVIRSGQVEIQLGNRLLATLEANEIFGEMALIEFGAPQRHRDRENRRRPGAHFEKGFPHPREPCANLRARHYGHDGPPAARRQQGVLTFKYQRFSQVRGKAFFCDGGHTGGEPAVLCL